MNGSVGQALRDARLAKKLTLEEVARATKIRPERIAELEEDDYMHFPNIVYARNFLILYAKYLGVDISRYPTLEIGFDTGVGEYSYLQQSEEGPTPHRRKRRAAAMPPEKPRWLIAFFILLVALAAGALIGWGIMTIKRLGPVGTTQPAATPASPTPLPTATPAAPEGGPAESANPAMSAPLVEPSQPTQTPPAQAVASPTVVVAVPVSPANEVPAVEPQEQEISIRSTRKTRLRVVRDNAKAPSIYHGNINPLMKPLVFVGRHFWIKTPDPEALEVTIGGETAPSSAVEIIKTPGI